MSLFSKCNNILHSNDGKLIISNFSYLSLLQLAGYVFPLITMPYLARVIGAEGFGRIAFASAIIVWFQTISDWGFTYTATRDVAQSKQDKVKISEHFSTVLWSRFLLAAVSFIVLLVIIFLVPYLRDNASIILVSFLIVPANIIFSDWFFQAIEKMKYITYFNLFIKALFTAAVFVFIKTKEDYILQPLFLSIGYFMSGIGTLFLYKKWGYTLIRPNFNKLITALKSGVDIFLNNLMPNLYNALTVLLLGFFSGSTSNGLYDGGNKFPSIFRSLHAVISRTFFPFLSRKPQKHNLFCVINLSSALICSIILFVFSPWLIRVFLGEDFINSIVVMRILSISVFFLALDNTYGLNYLIINHQERIMRNISVITSLIGLLISFPLVYYFSYVGAAITILISRVIMGTATLLYAMKYKYSN